MLKEMTDEHDSTQLKHAPVCLVTNLQAGAAALAHIGAGAISKEVFRDQPKRNRSAAYLSDDTLPGYRGHDRLAEGRGRLHRARRLPQRRHGPACRTCLRP